MALILPTHSDQATASCFEHFWMLYFQLKGHWDVDEVCLRHIHHTKKKQTYKEGDCEQTGHILVLWARAQTYSHSRPLGPHSVMIPMVNIRDLT